MDELISNFIIATEDFNIGEIEKLIDDAQQLHKSIYTNFFLSKLSNAICKRRLQYTYHDILMAIRGYLVIGEVTNNATKILSIVIDLIKYLYLIDNVRPQIRRTNPQFCPDRDYCEAGDHRIKVYNNNITIYIPDYSIGAADIGDLKLWKIYKYNRNNIKSAKGCDNISLGIYRCLKIFMKDIKSELQAYANSI